MNLVEALCTKKPKIRRPVPRHTGSHGTGWLDREFVISLLCFDHHQVSFAALDRFRLSPSDLVAFDWEVDPPVEPHPLGHAAERLRKESVDFANTFGFTVLEEIDDSKLDQYDQKHLKHVVLALQIKSARERALFKELDAQDAELWRYRNSPLKTHFIRQVKLVWWSVKSFWAECVREARDEV